MKIDTVYHWDRLPKGWILSKGTDSIVHSDGWAYNLNNCSFVTTNVLKPFEPVEAAQVHDQARLAVIGCEEYSWEALARACEKHGFLPLLHYNTNSDGEYRIHVTNHDGDTILRCFESRQFFLWSRASFQSCEVIGKLLKLADTLRRMGWIELIENHRPL